MVALLGPHIQKYSEAGKRWARVAPITKLLDDPGLFIDTPDGSLKIFRAYVGDDNHRVTDVLNAIDQRLKGYRHANLYVEPMNMPSPWRLEDTIAFFRAIVPELHSRGLKVAGPTWSTGNPEVAATEVFRSVQWCGLDMLSFHTYWGNESFTPWHALRPNRLWQNGDPPWVALEGGRDLVEGGQGGWKKDGVSAQQYIAELFSCDALHQKSPGYRGMTPFTCGPNQDWINFDLDGIVDEIIRAATLPPSSIPGGQGGGAEVEQIIATERKYGITHRDGANIYLAELIERPDPPNITVEGPPDALVLVSTNDNQHQARGVGHADLPFSHPAAYNPADGERGFFYAECEGARVEGLGWAFGVPGDTAPHRNVAVRFARRDKPIPPPIPPPEVKTMEWKLAFADYASLHPEVGQPIADIAHLPPDFRRAVQYSDRAVLVYDNGIYCVPQKPNAPAPPAKVLFFEDSSFVDVGPLLTKYADMYGVPLAGLVALIHAECGFNTHAVRRGVWPDVGAGYSQMTVQTAAGYGYGNGSADPANVEAVLSALQDRETGIRLAAAHFAICLGVVDKQISGWSGDERIILGLRAYNGGTGYGLTLDYASKFAGHIQSYRDALDLAHRVLANKGWE